MWLTLPPVPSAPSRSEVHWMVAERSPSSRSPALAVSVVAAEEAKVCPALGAVIVRSGAVLPGGGVFTVRVTWLEPVRLWPSVPPAGTGWVPAPGAVRTTAPRPRGRGGWGGPG